MNDNLHPYLEPELEARIVALILGEASPFEREELERLLAENPEAEMFKRRLESVHGLIGESTKSLADSEWKLSSSKRETVLAKIRSDEPESNSDLEEKVRAISPAQRRVIFAVAACLGLSIIAGILTPSVLKSNKSVDMADGGDLFGGSSYVTPIEENTLRGVTLEVKVKPELSDFEGFINYGEPVNSVNRQLALIDEAIIPEQAVLPAQEGLSNRMIIDGDVAQKTDSGDVSKLVTAGLRDESLASLDDQNSDPFKIPGSIVVPENEELNIRNGGLKKNLSSFIRSEGELADLDGDGFGDIDDYGIVNERKSEAKDSNHWSLTPAQEQEEATPSADFVDTAIAGELMSSNQDLPVQIKVRTKHVEARQANLEELGFDFTIDEVANSGGKSSSGFLSLPGTTDLVGVDVVDDGVSVDMSDIVFSEASDPSIYGFDDISDDVIVFDWKTSSEEHPDRLYSDSPAISSRSEEWENFFAKGRTTQDFKITDSATAPSGGVVSGETDEKRADEAKVTGYIVSGNEGGKNRLAGNDRPGQKIQKAKAPGGTVQEPPNRDALLNDTLAKIPGVPSERLRASHENVTEGKFEDARLTRLGDSVESSSRFGRGSLAQQETIRRQEAVRATDELLMEGRKAYSEGDYETAVQKYRESLSSLPHGTATADRRGLLKQHLSDVSLALSQKHRRVGRYEKARELLTEVDRLDPGNIATKKELEYLDDPIRANPSLTSNHSANVDKVRRSLYTGEGYYDLGLYDKAEEEFKNVLRTDPYNKAARRWMERTASIKADYYRAAYEQTRAEMLMQVDQEWELPILPVAGHETTEQQKLVAEKTNDLTTEAARLASDNLKAKKRLDYLDDPIRTNPSLVNSRSANIDKVRRSLYKGDGFLDLGLYDRAAEEYEKTLKIDPNNRVAREGLKKVASQKADGDKLTDNKARVFPLMPVDPNWKLAVPTEDAEAKTNPEKGGFADFGVLSIVQKPRTLLLPQFSSEGKTLKQALDQIRLMCRQYDMTEVDPEMKGLNIVLHSGGNPNQLLPSANFENVPVGDVLRWVSEQSGLTMSNDEYSIILSPRPLKQWEPQLDVGDESKEGLSKLHQTILPSLELQSTSLVAAASYLSKRAQENKKAEGLSFDLSDPSLANLVISDLKLRPVSLWHAAKTIADQTGTRFRINGKRIVFVPHIPLETKLTPAELAELEKFETPTSKKADSTFSLNVSDVSFKLAKASLATGKWPESAKVRPEEFVNALNYFDDTPTQVEKVACAIEQGSHPFMQQRNLMRVALSTAALGRNAATPLRLTVLLDQSGSMERADRAESVKRAFTLLAAQLQPQDEITLIGFARTPRLLAERVKGGQSKKLVEMVSHPLTEGGTNLEAALAAGLQLAKQQFVEGAQNRIILLTDGAANLGDALPEHLSKQVESMRQSGIAFDACGVGADGLNDEILSSLTKQGDGRYYFLDQPEDADAGFARQIAGALRPAAKNVKVQVIFNPERVSRFKLYGFEKHKLKKEDFRNDSVDAAEMAAEESGVALYHFEALPEGKGEIGTVSVRFLDTATNRMVERTWTIPYQADAASFSEAKPSLRLAGIAALFAEKLRSSPVGERVDLKNLRREVELLKPTFSKQVRFQELQQMLQQADQ